MSLANTKWYDTDNLPSFSQLRNGSSWMLHQTSLSINCAYSRVAIRELSKQPSEQHVIVFKSLFSEYPGFMLPDSYYTQNISKAPSQFDRDCARVKRHYFHLSGIPLMHGCSMNHYFHNQVEELTGWQKEQAFPCKLWGLLCTVLSIPKKSPIETSVWTNIIDSHGWKWCTETKRKGICEVIVTRARQNVLNAMTNLLRACWSMEKQGSKKSQPPLKKRKKNELHWDSVAIL